MLAPLMLGSRASALLLAATLLGVALGCGSGGPADSAPAVELTGSASPSAPSVEMDAPAAPSSSVVVEAPAAPDSRGASSPPAAIVWVKNRASLGGFRSIWVEPASASAAPRTERPMLVAVAPDSLWRVRTTKVKSCPHLLKNADGATILPRRAVTTTLDMPVLTRLRDGRTLAPWDHGHGYPTSGVTCPNNDHMPDDPGARWDVDRVIGVAFEGGAGPFVIARLNHQEKALYWATDFFASQHHTLDLARGVDVPSAEAPRWDRADVRNVGERKRVREAGADVETGGINLRPTERLTFLSVVPQYGPTGTLLASFRYAYPTVGAAADVDVGRYERGVAILSHVPPAPLAPYATLPAWVVPIMNALRSQHAFVIPAGQEAAFRAQFDALPLTVPPPPDPRPQLYR